MNAEEDKKKPKNKLHILIAILVVIALLYRLYLSRQQASMGFCGCSA